MCTYVLTSFLKHTEEKTNMKLLEYLHSFQYFNISLCDGGLSCVNQKYSKHTFAHIRSVRKGES